MSSLEHDKKAAKAEKRAAKEAKRANKALQAAAAPPPPPPASFDAELAAMFSNAQPAYSSLDTSTQHASDKAPSHTQRTQGTRSAPHSSTQNTKRRKVRSEAEGERQAPALSGGPWLSDTDSGESELQALSDDKAQQRRPHGDEGGKSDGEEGGSVELVHESILAARKSAKKGNNGAAHPSSAEGAAASEPKVVEAAGEDDGNSESARAIRDARTLFVGNIPLAVMSSKALRRKLLRHLQLCSPWPSRTLLEKLRFRSVPFAVPTGDYTAQNVEEANAKAKRRERARVWKHEKEEGAGSAPAQKFLTPAQKRKVAFINEELNQQAHSVNAYVTIAMLDSADADSPAASDFEKNLNAQGIAALTAHQADGTVFEGRHLRVDISAAIPASHRGGLPPTSSLGTPRSDVQDAPFTAFVGGLDYNADEEKLWTWFDLLLINEMGTPPTWEALEDSKIWKRMPAPESRATDGSGAGQSEVQKGKESDADTSDGSDEEESGPTSKATHSDKKACPPVPQRGSSWVRSIRLVRDNATQLGKGFGYVRFASESCVDEVLALAAQDEAVLGSRHTGAGGGDRNAKASQARAAGVKEYRRKMKFEGRPIRVSKCKMTTKNSGAGRRALDQKKQREELKRKRSVDGDAQESLSTPSRVRSAGAPTPGGSSPGQKKSATVADTPTQHRLSSSSKQVANPGPSIPYDAAKQARIEAKRKDPERLKRRAEKKEKKRAEEAEVRKLRDVLGDEADGKRKGKVRIEMKQKKRVPNGSEKGKKAERKKKSSSSEARGAKSAAMGRRA
ncbi:hypothetical protein IE81DRAFT_326015 [Ceraceosorus guamensis]|uniref:RRM domain-containing protein n=1 Tax=Ceraceosorus guamensis TaxID=1522189 RepID=A0A316VWX5_9BASI|nr:hypothetical protein IE81DRAFT_326015 [Ceraceosorus guamensis]PWN39965.1 hypothetical protein IE81DRAFT_326015 [Ceraceosorus guamensis]